MPKKTKPQNRPRPLRLPPKLLNPRRRSLSRSLKPQFLRLRAAKNSNVSTTDLNLKEVASAEDVEAAVVKDVVVVVVTVAAEAVVPKAKAHPAVANAVVVAEVTDPALLSLQLSKAMRL